MNINKFTQKSIEAVNQCEKIAYDHGHQEIDQEHFLYSLLTIDDSLIASLLEKMGINKETFLSQVQELLNKKPKVSGGQVYMSNDLNQVLLHGEDEMKAMKDEYVSVEHLFLAMIKHPNKAVKELFRAYGITRDRFLQVLSQIRGGQKVTSDNPEETYDSLEKYGYDLVKSGRFNKRKHELYDLKINESEAAVVRLIFDKYTNEGYGTWRIANYLNNNGYRTRSGKCWHQASVRGILNNLTYTGVLRSADARSPLLPELQIIKPEQFKTAADIFKSRAKKHSENPTVPLNTKGKSLLAGNVFCGHCGARLTLTTNGRYRKRKDGSIDKTPRIRYVCYGKTRKQTDCDGQTGYTMHKLDGIVEQVIKNIFGTMKGIPKSKIVSERYKKELADKKRRLADTEKEYNKALQKLNLLKAEVVKCLQGESSFSKDILSELITDAENKCNELAQLSEAIKTELKQSEQLQTELCKRYDEIISWSELYDSATIEAKKMIVNSMIKRIDVFRDYKLKIEFNFDMKQFFLGIDKEISLDMTA